MSDREPRQRRSLADRKTKKSRGLDEVFHYFISNDEREAREPEVVEPVVSPEPAPPPRLPGSSKRPWVLIAEPSRPLHCWLAADLLLALPETAGHGEIAGSFEPPAPFRPARWHAQPAIELERELAGASPGRALYVLRRAEVLRLLACAPASFEILLPVDPSEHGIQSALGTVAELSRHARRVFCLLTGTPQSEAADLHARLEATAHGEHGVEIVYLGSLPRGRDDDRALLEGVSILKSDPGAPSARALQNLGWSLADSRAVHDV